MQETTHFYKVKSVFWANSTTGVRGGFGKRPDFSGFFFATFPLVTPYLYFRVPTWMDGCSLRSVGVWVEIYFHSRIFYAVSLDVDTES